jgi:hypothetical protein
MLETLKNLGKALLFPLTLTSFVCLVLTRGVFEVAKFSTEFIAKRGLGITKRNGYKSDFEAKTLGSAIDRVKSLSDWFYKKSFTMPFSFFSQGATKGSGEVTTERVFKGPKPTKEEYDLTEPNPIEQSPAADTPPYITEVPNPIIAANNWSTLGNQNENQMGG